MEDIEKKKEMEKKRQRFEDEDWVNQEVDRNKKEMWIAYLLWFLGGTLGLHRIYLGEVGSAIAMMMLTIVGGMLTIILVGYLFLGAVLLWWLSDIITIKTMIDKHEEEVRLKAYDELRRRKDALDY